MLNYANFFDQTDNKLEAIKKLILKHGNLANDGIPMGKWAQDSILLIDDRLSITHFQNGDNIPCTYIRLNGEINDSAYYAAAAIGQPCFYLSFAEFNSKAFLSVPNLKHNIEYLLIGKV